MVWLNLARPHSTGIFDSRATAGKWTCESRIESVFNQRKFVVFHRICKRGPSSWKLENLNIFWRQKFIKNESLVICLHLKYVVCFCINFLVESKIAVVCSNVPSSQSLVQILECCLLRPGCQCYNFTAPRCEFRSKRNAFYRSGKWNNQIYGNIYHGSEKGLRWLTK